LTTVDELLAKALKLEPQNPELRILMGDTWLEKDVMVGGPAVKEYNMAIELDKTNAKPVLRIGKLYYRAKNPKEALKWYKDAIKIDSTFAPSYIELGELYLLAGPQYSKNALDAYKRYLVLNNDLEARDRFAQILWVNKLYEDAVNEITQIQKVDSSSFTLYRLLGYSYSEVGEKFQPDGFEKGLYALNKFFAMTAGKKDFVYLPSDYSALGKLLSKLGKDSLAIVELQRAMSMDTTNTDLNSEIGFAYFKSRNYNEAITYYNRKIAAGKPWLNDYIYLGLAYYFTKQFALADSALKVVTRESPELVLGHKFRAKSNTQLDPTSSLGLAKPHYERMVELITAKPENMEKLANRKDVIEGYEYLGAFYYINVKDIPKASEYFGKIKQLDSTNKKVKEFYNSPEYKDPNPKPGMAKPYYDKVVESALAKPENISNPTVKKDLIEAYEYLAAYYYTGVKDLLKAKEYFTKLKELDPTNVKAETFFNSPEGKG